MDRGTYIELDGRPSDCIAMAVQQKAQLYVSQEVWDEVDDMSDVLRKMEEDGLKPDPEIEAESEEAAARQVEEMARRLLSNPVIEDFSYRFA